MSPKRRSSISAKPKRRLDIRKIVIFIVAALICASVVTVHLHNQENRKTYYSHKVLVKPAELPEAVHSKIKIPIITYHYVGFEKDPSDTKRRSLTTGAYTLQNELQTLNEAGYTTHFVREIPEILRDKDLYSTRSAFLTFDDGYEDFYYVVLPLLKKYNAKATLFVINNYIWRTGFVTQPQLEEIRDSGLVEIGAHTMDHSYLKDMPKENAYHEIVESKLDLERRLGIKIFSFAYPYGAFTQETIDLAKKAEFTSAVSIINGTLQSKDNLYYLSRLRAGVVNGGNIVTILEGLNK